MIEIIDNLIQFLMTSIGCIWAGVLFLKCHRQPFFLLACFYGVFALSTLYWTLYLILFHETPPIFYVSDIGWVASYVFLLTLIFTMRFPKFQQRRSPLCYLAIIFCLPQFILYISHGDVFFTILSCTLTMFIAWFAIDGLVNCLRNKEKRNAVPFYILMLSFSVLEYCLWTTSCFWLGDTLINLYFYFDLMLSANMLLLLPGLKKAVLK